MTKDSRSKNTINDCPLSEDDLKRINTRDGLVQLLRSRNIKLKKVNTILRYEKELELLQIQLAQFQQWVKTHQKRVAILFEGRDAAGKGGAIRRFIEHFKPRTFRVVALPAPTEMEQGQWYFQRYIQHLPNPGEIVFFDRSWYNRAVVEPVNGFCTSEQYTHFLEQVPKFERMLHDDGIHLVKFWFDISKDEQKKRFDARRSSPLKHWKIGPVDEKAQELWDDYSHYAQEMFVHTHTDFSPWNIVQANVKRTARLESIRHVLSSLPYEQEGDAGTRVSPDSDIVQAYDPI